MTVDGNKYDFNDYDLEVERPFVTLNLVDSKNYVVYISTFEENAKLRKSPLE